MSKLRLFLLTGFLAAAVAPLYGCGNECGEGLTEQDGECVVVAEGCGAGTILENRQCVIDESGCGAGTLLEGEVCVPSDQSCAEGTLFDSGLRTCVADTEIVCGEGTEDDGDGICVPSEQACSDKTTLDDNGRCTINVAACGAGTELDPNTGNCVLADVACGEGLAIDTSTNTCVPTEEVCDEGTRFDADSGLCLPDACEEGDVLIDGICMSPAEELAYNADLDESENNDPARGGTANSFTPNEVGAEAFVFAGTIDEPADRDGDGVADQDVDVFEFDASAGEWFELMVQSTGLPSPAFKIEGPAGYERYSQALGAGDVARDFVAPVDGTYTISVLPSRVLDAEEGFAPVGSELWSYVASLNAVDAPAATDVDVSSGAASFGGELLTLNDNLFSLNGLSADDALTLTPSQLGEDAQAEVQVWADTTTLAGTYVLEEGAPVALNLPSTGDALVLVDWVRADGTRLDFEIDAAVTGSQNIVSLADGESESLTVSVNALDRIVASQVNSAGARLDVAILNPDGDRVVARRIAESEELPAIAVEAGVYSVTLTNNTGSAVDATLMANITPPHDFGQLPIGGEVNSTPIRLQEGAKAYFKFSATAQQVLSYTQQNADDAAVNLTVFDTAGEEQRSYASVDPVGGSNYTWSDHEWELLQSDVTWIVEVEAQETLSNFVLTLESIDPQLEGSLSDGGSLTVTSSTTRPKGLSGWHLVEFTEPLAFYGDVTETNGADVDFYLYDLEENTEISVTGINGGTKTFGGQFDEPETFLMRVKCDAICNGYEVNISGFFPEADLGLIDLGTDYTTDVLPVFNSGQSMTYNFSVPAGAMIEITHDNGVTNDDGTGHGFELFDTSDTSVFDDSSFYPLTHRYSSAPEVAYHYTPDGGEFRLEVTSKGSSTEQEVYINVFEPEDLGTIAKGESASATFTDTLTKHKRHFYQVTFDEAGAFGGAVRPAADGDDIDMHAYDATFEELSSWTTGTGARSLGGKADEAGTYLFALECEDDQCTDFDFDVHLAESEADLGTLNADSVNDHALGAVSYYQPKKLTFTAPAGQVIALSHDNDEGDDHHLRLRNAAEDSLIYDSTFQARSYSSPQYEYWYTADGGEFTIEFEGKSLTTNTDLRVELMTPQNIGTLDTTGVPLDFSTTDSCAAGESLFYKVGFSEAMTFDAELTPAGDEDLDVYLLDATNEELAEFTSSAGERTFQGAVARFGGEQLLQIECAEETSGFDLTLSNAASLEVDLGHVDADDSVTSPSIASMADGEEKVYAFTVSPGQIIEVSHDNDGGDAQDVYMYDSEGRELYGDSNMYSETGNRYGVDYAYVYSPDGDAFSVYLLSDHDTTNQTVTVRTHTPNALGTLYSGDSASYSHSTAMGDNQRHYHQVTLDEDGELSVRGDTPSEDIDLRIYDLNLDEIDSFSGSGLDETIELEAGTYLMAIEADGDIASYNVTFGVDVQDAQ